jgi:hypothetical protein
MKNDRDGDVSKVSRPGIGGAMNLSIMAGPKLTELINLTATIWSLLGMPIVGFGSAMFDDLAKLLEVITVTQSYR